MNASNLGTIEVDCDWLKINTSTLADRLNEQAIRNLLLKRELIIRLRLSVSNGRGAESKLLGKTRVIH